MGFCSRQVWQEEGELLHYLIAVVDVVPSGTGGSVANCVHIWNDQCFCSKLSLSLVIPRICRIWCRRRIFSVSILHSTLEPVNVDT